jgi:hypothetical protein
VGFIVGAGGKVGVGGGRGVEVGAGRRVISAGTNAEAESVPLFPKRRKVTERRIPATRNARGKVQGAK